MQNTSDHTTETDLQTRLDELEGIAQKYRTFIERANDAIFSIAVETGRILDANPKATELTGYSKDDLCKMKVWDIHPKEEREKAEQLFRLVSSKGSARSEMKFLRKDDREIIVDVSASVIEYDGQRVIQRICRDVSEEKELERENRTLKDYYERILNMMPDGLNVKRLEGDELVIEFENEKLKDMFSDGKGGRSYQWHRKKEKIEDSLCYRCLEDDSIQNYQQTAPDGRVFRFTSSRRLQSARRHPC